MSYLSNKDKFWLKNVREKPIIDKGPYDEYQMDLFYLDEDIVDITGYKYIASIINHFSKWIWSYAIFFF